MADVRLASTRDAPRIAEMLHAFNVEFDTPTLPAEVLAQRLPEVLGDARAFVLLVEDPPAGLALVTLRPTVWYAGDTATLDELYVVPQRRGQRLGGALIAEVQAEAARRGADYVEIQVDESDTDAMRFYRSHGFVDAEPGDHERARIFWRELRPMQPAG